MVLQHWQTYTSNNSWLVYQHWCTCTRLILVCVPTRENSSHTSELSTRAPNPPQRRSSRGSQWYLCRFQHHCFSIVTPFYGRAFDISKCQLCYCQEHISWLCNSARCTSARCKAMSVSLCNWSNWPTSFSLVLSSAIPLSSWLILRPKCYCALQSSVFSSDLQQTTWHFLQCSTM